MTLWGAACGWRPGAREGGGSESDGGENGWDGAARHRLAWNADICGERSSNLRRWAGGPRRIGWVLEGERES